MDQVQMHSGFVTLRRDLEGWWWDVMMIGNPGIINKVAGRVIKIRENVGFINTKVGETPLEINGANENLIRIS